MLSAWPISFLALPALVSSYSFQLRSTPKQCGNIDLEITEGQGKPPYTALVVPFGSSPTNGERRRIFEHQFNEGNTSFQMTFPENSGFVITVSDQNGVGTGGTSVPQTVASGDDDDCLIDPNANKATFSFQILPNNAINQCDSRTLAWSGGVKGDVKITVVIPGGQTFNVPTTNPMMGLQGNTTGVQWVPNIRTGTSIIMVAADDSGPGSGGSYNTAVGNNPNGDDSCLGNDAPSSTPGTPAGAVETGGTTQPPSGSSSTNVGAIVGGVIGGIVGALVLILVAWFIMRRRRHHRRGNVDLLPEGEGGNNQEFYQPEPFIVPSSAAGTGARTNTEARPSMSDVGRRYSALSTTDDQFSESNYTSATPAFAPSREFLSASGSRSNASRKSPGGPGPLRPVNVVQHEDGGEVPVPMDGEGETIELPPAYTAVGSSRRDLGTSAAGTAGPSDGPSTAGTSGERT